MIDFDGYNALSLRKAEKAFRSNPDAYHPATIHWIRCDFAKLSRKPRMTNDKEYGLARIKGINLEREYTKHMRANGIQSLTPQKVCQKLHRMLRSTLKQWKKAPRVKEFERKVRTKSEVEKIVNDISKRMGIPPPRIGWVSGSGKPVRMAIYITRPRRSLIMHEHVTSFRVCDITILALHEVLGHAYQEDKTSHFPVSTSDAEFCAMMCENVSYEIMKTLRYAKEWRLFRITRALVDMRLNCFPSLGKDAQDVWSKVDKETKGALSAFVPFRDEAIRCGALPAQALTYIVNHNDKKPRGCHAKCK